MALSSMFKLRSIATPEIVELLEQTTLGTNGAQYQHLDTAQRIQEADNPLFLSLERNKRALANITFCRRQNHWYIRYFAFQSDLQSGKTHNKQKSKNSLLKKELSEFFDSQFINTSDQRAIDSMYAYIDPKNERSLWMSENFGFSAIARLASQSFSRYKPKLSSGHIVIKDWDVIKEQVKNQFSDYSFVYTQHCSKGPFHILKSEAGEILAYGKFTRVNWRIHRLAGKLGKLLVNIIPFVPIIRKYIKPKKHTFLVPEIVWFKDNDSKLLERYFSSVLAMEKLHMILWWVDEKDEAYKAIKTKVDWGLLHKIIGVAPVEVVQRTRDGIEKETRKPVFVIAYDMV